MKLLNARPACVRDTHLTFLDGAREEGCNMWTMPYHLPQRFPELSLAEAGLVVKWWITSWRERATPTGH
jgi:hypothetical protein